jgi:alpha-D-ribose 1-methylphosphonate 5-triphosphate diphosphatase PhnM
MRARLVDAAVGLRDRLRAVHALQAEALADGWTHYRFEITDPARSVGLQDRDRNEVGCRADLVAVRELADYPLAIATGCRGHGVHRAVHGRDSR